MTTHIRVGGAWEEIVGGAGSAVTVGGANRTIEEVHVRIAGVWEQVFQNIIHSLSDVTSSEPFSDTGGATTTYDVAIQFLSTGDIFIEQTVNADTGTIGTFTNDPADTWVRCTHQSGDTMNGGASLGVWHRTNSNVVFQMSHTSGGGNDIIQGDFTFELATDSGGSNIVATATNITFSAGEAF